MEKKKIILKIILILILIILAIQAKTLSQYTQEQIEYNNQLGEIYIIGSDNLGELEKYDSEKQEYVGLMPKLFENIKEKTGLNLKYTNIKTNKEETIKNSQGEIVSSIIGENLPEGITEKIKIFTLPNEENVYIGFTKIASEEVKNIVKTYINEMSQEEREKLILTTLQKDEDIKIEQKKINYTVIFMIIILILMVTIITYIKNLKKKIRKEKSTDEVTGYSNYNNFEKNFNKFITDEVKANYCLVDLGIDIKNIEDIYGYEKEEEIIKEVAQIINDYIKDNEMFCRRTSNSFLILLDYISQKNLEERIVIIEEKIKNQSKKVNTEIKIHFGIYNLKNNTGDLKEAVYYAMQTRKECEKNDTLMLICNQSLENKIDENYHLEKDILDAFKKKEFLSYVKPIINLKEKNIYAVEFLARWENERNGFVKPRRFLKILEKNNLIYELDKLMFKNACELIEYLKINQNREMRIFCNFARSSLTKKQFIDNIKETLEEYRVNPNLLGIVITEDFLTKNTYNIKKVMKELKEIGVLIILDNFGGGANSLKDISEFECDFLKISNTILKDIDRQKNQEIVNHIVILSKNMGIEVICDNIEKSESEEILKNIGVNLLEGNLYCQPIPVEEMLEMENKDMMR